LEDGGKDLREMEVRRWQQYAVSRGKWASVIMEVKALTGTQGQTVRKKEMQFSTCRMFLFATFISFKAIWVCLYLCTNVRISVSSLNGTCFNASNM
jgi:hypothetical protein